MDVKMPYHNECQYCGIYYTPISSKSQHCSERCTKRHYKERVKRRRLTQQGFEGVFPIETIPNKLFYTIEESAFILGSTEKTVRKLIANSRIKVIKEDKLLRVPFQSINALIKIQEDDDNN